MKQQTKAGPRRRRSTQKAASRHEDASLYPLDPEDAIKAILDAGPHPKNEKATNRRRYKPKDS